MLRTVWWYSFTDVSGQPTEPLFKVKAVSVTNRQPTPRDVPDETTERRKPEISYLCPFLHMGVEYWGTRELENTAQWNLSKPHRQHTTEYREKIHNEELYSLYPSRNIIGWSVQGDEICGACGTCGGQDKWLQIFGVET